jgi:retron-type reverse transcriptase
MRSNFTHTYEDIISVENLLLAWREFLRGKRKKKDVQNFELRLMDNITSLHQDLKDKKYAHGGYHAFKISDPKPRDIHKASVRDRLLHHALYRKLYPFFNKTFVTDSYSCRLNKGTHKAINRFRDFSRKASRNHRKTIWILKCDVRKFFASISHQVLFEILKQYIKEQGVINLISEVVSSFQSTKVGVGLPLGNLTSQLLVNIYMNEFDQFVKHKLKARFYIRYADDFVFLSQNKKVLEDLLPKINDFLKITLASGVDFLGWMHFPDHRVLRTTTKKRMFKRIAESGGKGVTVQSYLGMLGHGNTEGLKRLIAGSGDTFV